MLAVMAHHLVSFGVDIVSITRNANGVVIVILSDNISAEQLAHVGLV